MRLGYELLAAETDGSSGASGSGGAAAQPPGGVDASSDVPSDAGGASATPPGDSGLDFPPDADAPADDPDAAVVPAVCQSYSAFQSPERVQFSSSGETWGPGPSPDNSLLFVGLTIGSDENVAWATRTDRGALFGVLSQVANVNSGARDGTPFVTSNGLSLYLFSERAGGLGSRDLMLATRSDTGAAFSAPIFLTALNSSAYDHEARLSADERSIVFESTRAGGAGGPDLWLAERAATTDAFVSPRNLGELNRAGSETGPALSADGLTLMFASDRPGGAGGTDIWRATRSDRASTFGGLQNVSELNSNDYEYDVALALDGSEVFFVSTRLGQPILWRALRACTDP